MGGCSSRYLDHLAVETDMITRDGSSSAPAESEPAGSVGAMTTTRDNKSSTLNMVSPVANAGHRELIRACDGRIAVLSGSYGLSARYMSM